MLIKEDQDLQSPAPKKTSAKRLERVTNRRRELGELTLQLVREKGFGALSVNELAERASMSIGGLYRYIKTKSDLLEIICDQINLGLYDRMMQAASSTDGIEEKLKAAFQVYWDIGWDSEEPILMAYREWQALPIAARRRYIKQEKQINEILSDIIRVGVINDEFRAVDENLLASEMILLAQMRALKGWTFRGQDRLTIFTEHWELIRARLRKLD